MSSQYQVDALWRYPVKSMQGEKISQSAVTRNGFLHDRGWAIVDQTTERVLSGKTSAALMQCASRYFEDSLEKTGPNVEITLPDGTILISGDHKTNVILSDYLGMAVELKRTEAQPSYSDAYPVHILSVASLRYLSSILPDDEITLKRFRPNILLGDNHDKNDPVEFDWIGKKLNIGSTQMVVDMGTERCVMTTRQQRGLPKSTQILKTLSQHTNLNFGVYADIIQPGDIRLGQSMLFDHQV